MFVAFFTGRLRRRFIADVESHGGGDAARQVSAGYVCLAIATGWLISGVAVLTLNPSHIEAHGLALLNAVLGVYGFYHIRRRTDARHALGLLILAGIASIGILSLRHSGVVPPIISTTPAIAGITALFLKGGMRLAAIAVGACVAVLVSLTSVGMIGFPTTYTPENWAIVSFISLMLSAVLLGGVAWLSIMARDYALEKLRLAHEAMTKSTARSRVALEAAKVGLWDVPDIELRRFHVSESFQSITGYTAEEFDRCFDALEDFVHPDDIAGLREAFTIGQKRMSRLRVDFRLKTKSRGYRWFSARARYGENPDGSLRLSGSLQDINFIKAAEEALRAGRDRAREANKAKSDFIAVMSHEVRTPLNAILGSVEVLKRGDRDKETLELANLIDDAGRGMLRLVNDLLDVSKIEAGKVEVALEACDLPDLVTRTADVWRPQASAKGLDLVVDCTTAHDTPLMIDAGRVRQIISNLLSNAIKFTDAGDIRVSLHVGHDRNGDSRVTIEVADSGPGIPADVRERIFAPFEQGENGADRGGTGLGLFISRRLARLMGGELELDAAHGGGALFRLTLAAKPHAGETADSAEASLDPVWAGRRVLCVDDNETNRRIVELLLSKFGVDVTACATGGDAIAACERQTFDAILMDIVMPGMDGPETLARIRQGAGGLNTATPAVALTAKLSPDDLGAYANAGFDAVAGKPINVRELALALAPFMVRADAVA